MPTKFHFHFKSQIRSSERNSIFNYKDLFYFLHYFLANSNSNSNKIVSNKSAAIRKIKRILRFFDFRLV